MTVTVHHGDSRDVLKTLTAQEKAREERPAAELPLFGGEAA